MLRPSPLVSDLPTLHFILAPAAHPASIAAAALATMPWAKPSLPSPAIVYLPPAAAPTAVHLRLPVRAALEQAGATLAVAPQGSIAAERSLGALFEAGRKDSAEAPFVVVRRAVDAALLDAAMAQARKSATGRRVLKQAEAALGGRPVPLQVRDLGGNLGEYDYMAGVLRLDRALLASDLKQAAATLIHEIVHVLQHQEGVPAEALELELEAHIVSMAVSRELGIALNSFEAAAAKALAKGPRAYADWMAGQLPGKVRLLDSDLRRAREQLADEVDDLENAARVSAKRLSWARRDLSLLKSRKGRDAYQAFADRVLRLIKGNRHKV